MTSRSDDLPQLIKVGQVCDMLSVSRSTIYRWVEMGEFPKPITLGQDEEKRSAVRWDRKVVMDWLMKRAND